MTRVPLRHPVWCGAQDTATLSRCGQAWAWTTLALGAGGLAGGGVGIARTRGWRARGRIILTREGDRRRVRSALGLARDGTGGGAGIAARLRLLVRAD